MTEQTMRAFYIKHRLENLPGGGRFLTAQQDDGSMIDVEDIPGGEWDAFIRKVKAEVLREAADALGDTNLTTVWESIAWLESRANTIESEATDE